MATSATTATAILDYRSDAIVGLMLIEDKDCDELWLKDALQRAVMLELATIPPYACGLWSIEDPQRDAKVHKAVREIIFDEMSHFGLVGNILSAIGGAPVVADRHVVPKYSGPLPGGVRPQLNVYLSRLDMNAADMYSQIEKPDRPLARAIRPDETHTSIGAFYDKLWRVLERHGHLFGRNPGPQMEFDLSGTHGAGNAIVPIRTLEDAGAAIEIIMAQGEGTTTSPDNPFPGEEGELAHYYVFREIYHGRKLVRDEASGTWTFTGDPVPMPVTHPMARIPDGGWSNDPENKPAPDVQRELDAFNGHYSAMLRSLHTVWRTADAAERRRLLGSAIGSMGMMRETARALMGMRLPSSPRESYGPEFLYVEDAA
ncbi:ferritin-like protein [Streptomyces capparidis]